MQTDLPTTPPSPFVKPLLGQPRTPRPCCSRTSPSCLQPLTLARPLGPSLGRHRADTPGRTSTPARPFNARPYGAKRTLNTLRERDETRRVFDTASPASTFCPRRWMHQHRPSSGLLNEGLQSTVVAPLPYKSEFGSPTACLALHLPTPLNSSPSPSPLSPNKHLPCPCPPTLTR
jgi:hypothetical protein